jgi:hypothetical protein
MPSSVVIKDLLPGSGGATEAEKIRFFFFLTFVEI